MAFMSLWDGPLLTRLQECVYIVPALITANLMMALAEACISQILILMPSINHFEFCLNQL